jgi:hypothetical protein
MLKEPTDHTYDRHYSKHSLVMETMAPERVYRAQSDISCTGYDEDVGFVAQGHYYMDYNHWLNKDKFERHLNWEDRSLQSSPFISVFDNLGDCLGNPSVILQRLT